MAVIQSTYLDGTNIERCTTCLLVPPCAHLEKGFDLMAKKGKTTKGKRGQFQSVRSRPRQPDLPGTEDRAIKPLEDIAASYADVRDRRMELNREEAELKQHALKLMKKYDKTIYKHDGIEIRIVPGEDDVKVKIKKPGDDEDDEDVIEIGATAEQGDTAESASEELRPGTVGEF